MREMAARLSIVSAERITDELSKLMLTATPEAGLDLLVRHRRGRDRAARAARAAHGGRRAPPAQGRLHALADRARARRSTWSRATASSPTSCCGSRRSCTTSASRAPGRCCRAARWPSTTTRWSAPSWPASGSPRCGSPTRSSTTCPGSSSCTCGSTGTATGEWTDSAVRRYVRDAGPLLTRLHALTRADCTTRNARKAARLAATYDALEARIEVLREQEELDKIRPDLDGEEIMRILGLKPGPLVGQALELPARAPARAWRARHRAGYRRAACVGRAGGDCRRPAAEG